MAEYLSDKEAAKLAELVDTLLDNYEAKDIIEAVAEALVMRAEEELNDKYATRMHNLGTKIADFLDGLDSKVKTIRRG